MSLHGINDHLYSTRVLELWQPYSHSMSVGQFAERWAKAHPEARDGMWRPFRVSFHTLSGQRRARSVVIDPNIKKNGFSRLLWNIRCAMGAAWADFKQGVTLLVGGKVLHRDNYALELRRAAPYTLIVRAAVDGHAWPEEDPAREELEQRRVEAARRRAEAEARRMRMDEGQSAAVRHMMDNVAGHFARGMADVSVRANAASGGSSRFAVISEPLVARANAISALRDPAVYEDTGYADADDFFARGLHAPSTTDAVNALSHDMATAMRKVPADLRVVNAAELERLYRSQAVRAPLFAQWRNTVDGFLGQHDANPSSAEYRVAVDYGLVAHDQRSGRSYSAQRAHEKKKVARGDEVAEKAVAEGRAPFASYALSAREGRTEGRMRRWARDLGLVRAALGETALPSPSRVAACASPTSCMAFVGDSMNSSSMPALDPIAVSMSSSSMPIAEPLSMPAAEPLSVGSSMPATEPQSVGSSMPAAAAEPQSVGSSMSAAAAPVSESLGPSAAAVAVAPPAAEAIQAEVDPAYPTFPSMVSAARHPLRALADDPLAAELARDVIESGDYSAVIVPDETVIPRGERASAAAQLAAMDPARRKEVLGRYLLQRHYTSGALNALLSGEAKEESAVLAPNMKTWSIEARLDGSVHIRDYDKKELVPASVYRIAERPEAVIIYTPVSYKSGQY